MNFKFNEIKENYPNAFSKYCDFSNRLAFIRNGEAFTHESNLFSIVDLRELYDFFETKGVYCSLITHDKGEYGWRVGVKNGKSKIETEFDSVRDNVRKAYYSKDRHLAECKLFQQAFKILENQINEKSI